jgi:ATP-dependent Lon protease
MATAIASVATGKAVSEDVAMTGELTLSGQVLPIGGLREKVLAAQRAGIPKVIFPRENESDLEELPPETRKALEFIPVDWIDEVLEVAFDGSLPKAAPARQISPERKAAAAR